MSSSRAINGGLGMAVEEVFDAELAWYAEWDDAPSKIMAHHWPGITNYRDVTTVDWSQVEPVDIISGGSPCQDLSLAGRRKGMTEGTRSNLWESMREAIATIKPTYVVWENVRGALSAKAISVSDMEHGDGSLGVTRGDNLRALGRVLGDLADLGYDCQWRGLRAADVGAPHGRFRVFILATRRATANPAGIGRHEAIKHDWRGAETINGASISDEPDSDVVRTRPVGEASTNSESQRRGICDRINERAPDREINPPRNNSDAPSGASGTQAIRGHVAGDPEHDGHVASAGGRSVEKEPTERRKDGPNKNREPARTSNPLPPPTDWGVYAPAIRRWEAVRGTAPAPTELTAKGKHRLNAAFAEWMMGLNPGHVTGVPGLTRNEQLKAIGNGVVPAQAIAALKNMLEVNQ